MATEPYFASWSAMRRRPEGMGGTEGTGASEGSGHAGR
jgi:hypothetical protein